MSGKDFSEPPLRAELFKVTFGTTSLGHRKMYLRCGRISNSRVSLIGLIGTRGRNDD